jgi:pyruvate formate lyase activating enzyme
LSDAALDNVSLVLLDLKTWDTERHRRLTGMENGPTLAFARRLAAQRKPIWLRFVLVPGLSDDPADIEKIATFAAELGVVERVDVLPFHQMGQYKWKKLGIEYTLDDVTPPTNEVVERTCCIFRGAGLKAY